MPEGLYDVPGEHGREVAGDLQLWGSAWPGTNWKVSDSLEQEEVEPLEAFPVPEDAAVVRTQIQPDQTELDLA